MLNCAHLRQSPQNVTHIFQCATPLLLFLMVLWWRFASFCDGLIQLFTLPSHVGWCSFTSTHQSLTFPMPLLSIYHCTMFTIHIVLTMDIVSFTLDLTQNYLPLSIILCDDYGDWISMVWGGCTYSLFGAFNYLSSEERPFC